MSKACSSCKTVRELSFFAKNKRASDQLCSKCKVCQQTYRDATRERKSATDKGYREKNADAIRTKKKAWVQANREWKRASNRKWAEANPEKAKQSLIDWKDRNPGKTTQFVKDWAAANPDRYKALAKDSRTRNRHLINARTATYRARKIKATPVWADPRKIAEFYVTADALNMWTGEWHHVDHIVPLRGRTVCGLHVESNLQVLTQSENCKKNACYWPDMPEEIDG